MVDITSGMIWEVSIGIVFVYLFRILAHIVHELGHAVTLRYYGCEVEKIEIGNGIKLFEHEISRIKVRVSIPLIHSIVVKKSDSMGLSPKQNINVFLMGGLAEFSVCVPILLSIMFLMNKCGYICLWGCTLLSIFLTTVEVLKNFIPIGHTDGARIVEIVKQSRNQK